MKKNKQKVLDSLLNELLVSVQGAKDFAIEQAPDIAKEMLAEEQLMQKQGIYQSIAMTLVGLGLLSFGIFGPSDAHFDGWAIARFLVGAFGALLTFIGIGCGWESFINLKRLQVAPKYFLLKKLSKLVS